jgi:hypothetical protein
LHRLHDHERHRLGPSLDDCLFQVLQKHRGELGLGLVRGAVVPVRVSDMDDVGHERLEGDAERCDTVDREGAHRRPVVGDAA